MTREELKKLNKGDIVYVACKVEAVFIDGGFVQVSTRDCEEGFDAYEDEIKELEQEPSGDVISRQAVQDYIAKYLSQYLYDDVREAVEVIDEYIGELPSVKQEPKTGDWIDQYNDGNWHCSKCGAIVEKDEQINHNWYFCYHCGAKMVEQERSDKE